MTAYYLRMDGVNLANFVYDTQDLSTIRGGGLLLLYAVDEVPKMIDYVTLEPVTTGASSGLFEFHVPDDATAEKVRQDVDRTLRNDPDLKHATFVIDVIPASTDFVQDREALIARNRWRQMRQPRLAMPMWNEKSGIGACQRDLVRPATETMYGAKETEQVSASVKARREFGCKQKQDFYFQQTGTKPPRDFALHFDELTHEHKRGNLHHKMAVIYLDGNGFGKLQNENCHSPQEQNNFDTIVKDYRRNMLKAVLHVIDSSEGWISKEGRYRFETLLWGGDEFIWVVPAWKGWETLALFYRESHDWKFAGQRLTHAGGMVFCHHNAPVHRITSLAQGLAERAKEKSRDENLFAYQVLESFDHTGDDLDRFRAERCYSAEGPNALILRGEGMDDMTNTFTELKENRDLLPRRKLYQIIRQLRSDPQQAEDTIEEVTKGLPDAVQGALTGYFGENKTRWFHIAELWDYIG